MTIVCNRGRGVQSELSKMECSEIGPHQTDLLVNVLCIRHAVFAYVFANAGTG